MPSSLVTIMRMTLRSLDFLHPAHIWRQRLGHGYRAALLLVGFHHGNQRAADGDTGTVERVDVTDIATFFRAIARVHAARLELAAIRARRNFPVHVLTR